MATGNIGEYHVFQVLFVDSVNVPIVVTSPYIDIFYFNSDNEKVMLVDGADLISTAETGRYVYPYLIDGTLIEGLTIYAEMWGVEPDDGLNVVAMESLDLVSRSSATGSMIARFVKTV